MRSQAEELFNKAEMRAVYLGLPELIQIGCDMRVGALDNLDKRPTEIAKDIIKLLVERWI